MPIVTAAGYPTLVAPTTEAAPTPGAPYQNIQADPNAFGAGVGRAQQQLGDTFEKASNQFEAVALEQQRLTNQLASDNSTNYAMDEVQKKLHGDPNIPGDVGFYGLKGDAAVNARKPTMEAIDTIINNARSKLTNPRQQLMFDSETRRMRNYWSGEVGRHYDQQLNAAVSASLTASRQLAEHQQASAAANIDEVGFGLGVQKEMEAANKQAQHLGFDQTWLDNEYDKIRAKATKQWVDSVGVKNPLAADEFLEHNKDALLPGEYRQLKTELHSRAIQQKAQEANYGVPPGQRPTEPSKIGGKGLIRGGAIQQRVSEMGSETFLNMAEHYESGGQNIPNYRFDQSHTAGGFFQITNSTWRDFANEAGVNTGQYPTAMSAPYDVQRKVAKTILESPNGGGPQHWTDFNPKLNRAIQRGDTATPTTTQQGNGTAYSTDELQQQFKNWQSGISGLKGQQANASFDAWATMNYPGYNKPTVQLVSNKPDEVVTRPMPPLEPNELPDTQVPGLSDRIQQLAKKLPPPDSYENREVWNAAVKIARQDLNMAYTNQQHQFRMKQQEDKANDEALTMDYYRKLGQPNGPTTQQVLNDTRFRTPEAVKNVVGFIERENKHDPAADVSKRTTHELFQRMTLPDQDQNKLRDMQTVHETYNAGNLTRQDHDWLIGQGTKLEKEADESFKEFKNRHIRATMGKILGNSAFLPDNLKDPEDLARFQQYTDAVNAKVESYKTQNKNPRDLWNPKNSDSVVSPEFLKEHGPSVVDAIKAAPDSVDLSTPEKVGEALRANRISYDAAVKRLEILGLKHKEVTGQPATVQ